MNMRLAVLSASVLAATIEPERIVHRLNLAAVYADVGEASKARATYQAALQLRQADYNDGHYRRQTGDGLRALR